MFFSSSNEHACKTNNAGGYMPFGHVTVLLREKKTLQTLNKAVLFIKIVHINVG